MTGSRPMSRQRFASSFALSGGASAASTGVFFLSPSLWVVPQATNAYPAALMPSSARLRGNREYGSVMHAIWNLVGSRLVWLLASGGRKPPEAKAAPAARNVRRFMAGSSGEGGNGPPIV